MELYPGAPLGSPGHEVPGEEDMIELIQAAGIYILRLVLVYYNLASLINRNCVFNYFL